jgi:hypothetical protein
MKILFVLLSFLSLSLHALSIDTIPKSNPIKWVKLELLSPTQFNIGEMAMLDKKDKMLKKYYKELKDKEKLEKYLLKKAAPAYLAPDGRYYIVDRHHTSRALYEAGVPIQEYPVEVVKDLSYMTQDQFFNFLKSVNGLYLYESGRGPITPALLPTHIWELEDDPYRSLSWLVREEGGYEKVEVNFLEFIWANYLRTKIQLQNGSEQELQQNLENAIEMAQHPDASHLPGYKSKPLIATEVF